MSLDRVRRVGFVCLFLAIASLILLFATAHGTLDWRGRPLGTDFSEVWAAGHMSLNGRAAEVWDWTAHFRVQQQIHHSAHVDLYGWHYPPPFLLIATALATLPYIPALVVWQLVTLIPFVWLIWRLVPRPEAILLTLAAPVTLICITHGHNGFLTALLLAGGLVLLDRRPFAAGLLLGCLIYKPQLGLVIPPLLIAGRNWRAIAGAMLSAAILVGATLLIWGWPVWQAFFDSLPLTRTMIVEHGLAGWFRIMSPFSAVRAWGASVAAAYFVQAIFTIGAVVSIVVVAWRQREPDLRNALVCAATLLATPYVLDYDFVVLLPAIAFLWRDAEKNGWLDWEKSGLALVWAGPYFARAVALVAKVPLGPATVVILFVIALRRWRLRASASRR